MIKAKINADGVVEKPDVVGAIFGQTEGLLGDELDLRELQKSGRIGRIEVDIVSKNGKSEGIVYVSSSLDQVETSVLASALETIDRVGPCKAAIKVLGIEDVRIAKREQVIERAKELLNDLIKQSKGKSADITDSIRSSIQVEEITSFGKDRCPAGPNVKDSEAIIIVEGRSDVLNLLRAGIKNAIAVEGTNVPQTVADLSKEKVATAFVDGDRGGELILRELFQVADVDFVARAPRAHEVEELTTKQIIKCLRNKVPGDQYMEMNGLTMDKNAKLSADSQAQLAADGADDEAEEEPAEEQPRHDKYNERFNNGRRDRDDDDRRREHGDRFNGGDRNSNGRRDRDDDDRRHGDRDLREKRRDRFNTDAVEKFKKKEPAVEEPAAEVPVEAPAAEVPDIRLDAPEMPAEASAETAEPAVEAEEQNAEPERKPREKRAPKKAKKADDEDEAPAAEEKNEPAERPARGKKDAVRQTKTLSPEQQKYRDMLLEMASTHNAKILSSAGDIIDEVAVKTLVDKLKQNAEGVATIVFDGVISQRILDVSAEKGIMTVVGTRMGNITKMPAGIAIWTKEDLY
jgi:DNA primase